MADTSTLGSMLQGVSQQPPHIRNDGQVGKQINLLSHAVKGITSRPGSLLRNSITTLPYGLSFRKFKVDGVVYQIGYRPGQLYIIDSAGEQQVVNASADALAYLGEDMEVYVYDNKETEAIYLLNRDKVVGMVEDTSAEEALVVRDVALVTSLGGLFSHTYIVNVETPDGIVVTGTYTAPDGVEDGDASRTTSDWIASQLASSLNNASNKPAGMNVVSSGSVIKIDGVPDLRVSTEDGAGGDTLVYQTNVSKSTEELANFAPHGTLVQVIGLDGSEDDFYMRFEVAEEDTVGDGFGSEGLWREWYNPSEPVALDPLTMPFLITREDDGSFTVGAAEWQPRRVGDEETNPRPGFVGKALRDVNGFQSRLVFIAGPLLNMSTTNAPDDFFKKSAVAEVATDPIEILSTAADEFSLQYLVPFDRDLVVFGDDNQFHISGGDALTFSNASMVQTTSFEMSSGARPVSTGKTVLFPFKIGGYSGIKEFFSSNSVDANSAVTLTETIPEYIKGRVTDIQISTNFDVALIRTDDPGSSNTVWVYKYLWDGERKLQSSWSSWELSGEISNLFFEDNQISALLYVDGRYRQTTLDLDLPDNPAVGYPIILDEYSNVITASSGYRAPSGEVFSEVFLPYADAVIIQGDNCRQPGEIVLYETPLEQGGIYVYRLPSFLVPPGRNVWAGRDIKQIFEPTMPFRRDGQGRVMRFIRLVVSRFIVHFNESGPMTAVRTSRYRSAETRLSNAKVALNLDPDDPSRLSITSGEFDIPYGEQSDLSQLTIEASGPKPISINEIEWVGQSRGGRRRV